MLRLQVEVRSDVPELEVEIEDRGLVHLRLGEGDRAVHGKRRRAGAPFAAQEHHDAPALDDLAGRGLHALEKDLDLGREHRHLDRLGDVLVRALRVAGQDVVGLLAGRQHHDRHARGAVIGAQAARELEAVHVRHVHIGDDEVGKLRTDLTQRLDPIGRDGDLVATSQER